MDSVKVDYSKYDTIKILPNVGFDWYVTGYCISHFDEQWGLSMFKSCVNDEGMDLFLKGLRSSPIAKGRIRYLYLEQLSFSQTFLPLREFCQLHSLELNNGFDIDHDDEVILQQLIAPRSGLRRLQLFHLYYSFFPLLFQQSSLQELDLYYVFNVKMRTELLPHSNTNLKKLIISRDFIHLLAALIIKVADAVSCDIPVKTHIWENLYCIIFTIVHLHTIHNA